MIDISGYTSVSYEYVLENLKDEEGCKTSPYHCSEGHLTIGIGHNLIVPLNKIINRKLGKSITDDEVIKIFDYDLLIVLQDLNMYIKQFQTYPNNVQYVLLSMCFNMGIHGLMEFKHFLLAISEGKTTEAIEEMHDSKWAKQVPNRVKKLARILQRRV